MVEMNDNTFFNTIIIGGGPAGIAAGLTITSRCLSCVIVEANQISDQKLGECLPPNSLPLFKKMGLESLLQNEQHHPYYGNKSVWGNDKIEEKLFLFDKLNQGILLNRNCFEKQLREVSKLNHLQWLEEYTFYSVEKENELTKVVLKSKTESKTLYCNYIIDATGRKASVCRKLGVKKNVIDELTSLNFKYKIKKPVPFFVFTESFENGWIYVSPSEKNFLTVMIFTDLDLIPSKKEKKEFIERHINNSVLIQEILQKNNIESEILDLKTRQANTTCLNVPFGKNWIAIGDAAYSFDPLSSYGITSALAAGYYGGHAVSDAISGKTEALETYHFIMDNAFLNYKIQLKEQYATEKRWKENAFWKRRLAYSLNDEY